MLNALQPDQAYFWATHQGAEVDLLLFTRGRRIGVKIERADAPIMTPSMRIALADLGLEQLVVLYPGSRTSVAVSEWPIIRSRDPGQISKARA